MPQSSATRIFLTARVSSPHTLSLKSTFRLHHRIYQTTASVYCSHAHDFLHHSWPCSSSGSSPTSKPPLTTRPLRDLVPFSSAATATTFAMAKRARSKTPQPTAQLQQQTRDHSGHSHGHGHGHHHHSTEFLTSTNKNDAGVRITRVGLYVNLGMAVAKFIGGYYFNSKALLADAIHSLTDLVSDIMTLATVSLSLRPPSDRFPGGYGKVESLGSLGVSGILFGSGVLMGWAALSALLVQFVPGFAEAADAIGLHAGHGHHHHGAPDDLGPNINAMWLAAGSIAIKEWLYRATLKIAKERRSNVLASNAYHHRVDSLTALVALVLIGASNVLHNAAWLDPVGGLVISLMIVQAGWGNTKDSILELVDVAVEPAMRAKVQRAAEAALPAGDSLAVRTVSGVKAGQTYLMDVELGVPGAWRVSEARAVEEAVRRGVGESVRGVKRVRVRFVPREDASPPSIIDEFVPPDVSPRASPEPEDGDHLHANGNGHTHKH